MVIHALPPPVDVIHDDLDISDSDEEMSSDQGHANSSGGHHHAGPEPPPPDEDGIWF